MGKSIDEKRHELRMRALAIGNENRSQRARMKRLMKSGDLDPLDLIVGRYDKYEPFVGRWTIEQMLMAVPGVGKWATHEILVAFQASPQTRMEVFSYERRMQLARLVAESTKREDWR